jgi:alpha-beta hydrolase superfamily lysophospholipase
METPPRPSDTGYGSETELTFRSDGLRLQGILHLPEEPRPHLVVGSHGLYSSGASPKQRGLAVGCCRMGLAYFRFDHRGCGRSEGRFADVTTLAGRRNDLLDAVAFLRNTYALDTGLGLFGSSFGGATCLAAAGALRPQRLVTLAAPVDSRSILAAAEALDPPVEPRFFKETFQFDLRDAIRAVDGILVIHGDRDEVIPPSHADIIFERVAEPKRQLLISGGDHRLSRTDHQQQFMQAALDWLKPLTNPPTADR